MPVSKHRRKNGKKPQARRLANTIGETVDQPFPCPCGCARIVRKVYPHPTEEGVKWFRCKRSKRYFRCTPEGTEADAETETEREVSPDDIHTGTPDAPESYDARKLASDQPSITLDALTPDRIAGRQSFDGVISNVPASAIPEMEEVTRHRCPNFGIWQGFDPEEIKAQIARMPKHRISLQEYANRMALTDADQYEEIRAMYKRDGARRIFGLDSPYNPNACGCKPLELKPETCGCSPEVGQSVQHYASFGIGEKIVSIPITHAEAMRNTLPIHDHAFAGPQGAACEFEVVNPQTKAPGRCMYPAEKHPTRKDLADAVNAGVAGIGKLIQLPTRTMRATTFDPALASNPENAIPRWEIPQWDGVQRIPDVLPETPGHVNCRSDVNPELAQAFEESIARHTVRVESGRTSYEGVTSQAPRSDSCPCGLEGCGQPFTREGCTEEQDENPGEPCGE